MYSIKFRWRIRIRYTEEDKPLEPQDYVKEMIETVQAFAGKLNLTMPEIWIEPGRSLVGDAGTSLYTVGSQKLFRIYANT